MPSALFSDFSLSSIRLTNGQIILRPFRLDDVEAHLEGEDEEQVKWISGGKSTRMSVQEWIKRNEESWKTGGLIFNFAIEHAQEGKVIGMVEANTDTGIEGICPGDANISYGLYPEARGKGYATMAVNLLIPFLKQRGLRRAVIRVHPDNVSSLSVPLRCGFEKGRHLLRMRDGQTLQFFYAILNP